MIIFFNRARLSVLSLAVAAASPGFAQAQGAVELSETVVTATRSPQLLSATLAHTTVISREDIERSQATDLVSLLAREAGLQPVQNGGIGTVSSVFLRGAPSLQTLVLIDGVPRNRQDASGAVSLEHVMLDNVERVEIVRGNVSAIYGSGAIGGVIQIFTRSAGKAGKATISLEFGPRASGKLATSVSVGAGDTALSAGISRVVTEGFSAVNTTQLSSANPDHDGYQNTSTHLSLTHTLVPGHQLGVKLARSQSETAYDNYFGAPTDLQSSTTTLEQASVFSANRWGRWNSRLSISQNSDKSQIRDNGVYGSTDGFATQATTLSWVNTLALNEDWLLTAGLEQQRQHVDTRSTSTYNTPYDRDRHGSARFAGVVGQWGAGTVQFNVRDDKVGDLRQSTGYLGFGYAITGQIKATLSTSTAFNAPPLGYLYAPDYGNPLLKPELAKSKELGLQYAQGGHLLRATYFDTRVEDQLTYDPATYAFANLARTRNNGLELSYRGTVGATELRASLTDQNPVNDITGAPLLRRAHGMASLGVSQTRGAWQGGANLRFSGERTDAYSDPATFSTVQVTLASYAVLDLTASYRWSDQLLLTARLHNVTDQAYQTVHGYNQQPRSVYAGLTWTPAR